MANYYDNWLAMWDEAERERESARRNLHEEDSSGSRRPRTTRSALVISPETGFRTWGTTTKVAAIPPGGHTGAHKPRQGLLARSTAGGGADPPARLDTDRRRRTDGRIRQHCLFDLDEAAVAR